MIAIWMAAGFAVVTAIVGCAMYEAGRMREHAEWLNRWLGRPATKDRMYRVKAQVFEQTPVTEQLVATIDEQHGPF